MAKTDRRKIILEEAARLFSAKRFDEVLMDYIAQQAGVGKGTIYTYFADKEELYFAVVFKGFAGSTSSFSARPIASRTPRKNCAAWSTPSSPSSARTASSFA